MKIRTKFTLFLLLFLSFIMVLMYFFSINISKKRVTESVGNHLNTAIEFKAQNIETLLSHYANCTNLAAANLSFTNFFDDSLDLKTREKNIATEINNLINTNEAIFRIRVLDKEGTIIASSRDDIGMEDSKHNIFQNEKWKTLAKDIHISEVSGEYEICFSAPIITAADSSGLIIVSFNPEIQLFPIVTDKTGLEQSANIFIVNKDHILVSPMENENLKIGEYIDTEQIKQCQTEHLISSIPEMDLKKQITYVNYRGEKVLGTHYYLSSMQWFIILEIEERDFLLQYIKFKQFYLIRLILFLILSFAASIVLSSLLTKPLRKIEDGIKKIIDGNLDFKFVTKRKDEFGQLSRVFNELTTRLIKSKKEIENNTKNLEEQIKANTTQLEKKIQETEHQRIATLNILNDLDIANRNMKDEIKGRVLTERTLQKSETKLRATFAAMTDLIIVYDSDGHYLEIAPTDPSNLFLPKQDMIGKNVTELFTSEKADFFLQNIKNTLKMKKLNSVEYSLHIDGKDIWFSALISPLSNDSVVWVARDITESKKLEIEQRDSQAKYRNLFEYSSEFLFTLDLKGNFTDVNKTATTITGYSKAELLTMNFKDYIDKKEYRRLLRILNQIYKTDQPVNNVMIEAEMKDKTKRHFAFSLNLYKQYNKIVGYQGSSIDITKRTRLENMQKTLFLISDAVGKTNDTYELYAKIREIIGQIINTENFYVALYDKERDSISFGFYADETHKDVNYLPSGRKLGMGLTDYVIKTGTPLFASKKDMEELSRQGKVELIGSFSDIWLGVPLIIENIVIGVIAVQCYNNPNLYADKDLEILTFISEEIALAINHKLAEEQIKRNLAEKNTLLKELYHRTKNNMQVISSMLRIQSQRSDDEFVHESFKEIVHKIQAMALVHQKLYQAEDLSRINLKEYIKEILLSLMQSYSIRSEVFSYILDLKNVFVTIDSATPLGLVLNELISNVFKHSFPENRKGKLTIKLEQDEDGEINLQLTDDGVGLPSGLNPEKTDSMGLQTVYSLIVYQLKGSLEYEDKDGLSWHIKFSDTKNKLRV